jgi:hypothetical protein
MGLSDTAIKHARSAEKPYKLADGKGSSSSSPHRVANSGAGSTNLVPSKTQFVMCS